MSSTTQLSRWRSWKKFFFGKRKPMRMRVFQSPTVCWLEKLEDRAFLTTDVFTNSVGGVWATESSWNLLPPLTATQDEVVSPSGTDGVVFHTSGSDMVDSLTSNDILQISDSSVTVTCDLSGIVRDRTGVQLKLSGTDSALGDVTLVRWSVSTRPETSCSEKYHRLCRIGRAVLASRITSTSARRSATN